MDKKKIADFLLLKPAVSSRNLTSLLLVAIFFGVYVAAGGKVSTLPDVQPGDSFGSVDSEEVQGESVESYEEEVVEEAPKRKVSKKKSAKRAVKKKRATKKRRVEPVEEAIEVEEEFDSEELDTSEDDLSSIEKRLNLGR